MHLKKSKGGSLTFTGIDVINETNNKNPFRKWYCTQINLSIMKKLFSLISSL